jgi:hypothetical protein
MLQHLDQVHPQYAHPRNHSGHPLPANILDSITLTLLEQKDAGISDMCLLTPLFDGDKENLPAPSMLRKRKSNVQADSGSTAKKVRALV